MLGETAKKVYSSAGWEFKLLSSVSGRQFDLNAIINRYDYRIAILILSDLVFWVVRRQVPSYG